MSQKIKVLLVHPEISHSKYNFNGVIENEPLELEYIVSVLRQKDIECEIFDVQRESITLEEKIKKYRPNVMYICGRIKQENFMKNHIISAKKFDSKIVTIAGGLHVQKNYERLFMEELDFILTTFDVYKIVNLIEGDDLTQVSGICYKRNGDWIVNEAEPFDINRLPHPDRTYFYKNRERYRYLELAPCAQVRTSYGCVFHCNFCYRNLTNCGKYVVRDIEDVVREIEEVDCENIYFIDDDFLLSVPRLKKFIMLVKERGIKKKYVCFGRVDFIIHNKQIMRELKEIGFYYVLSGLEAISDNYLSDYRKLTSVEVNVECIRFMNEIGIHLMGMLIVDLDFKRTDFEKIYKWVKQIGLKHVAISIFTPIMGTEIYEQYKERLISLNPEDYDYLHVVAKPVHMSVRRYYFYYYILLIKLFLLAQKLGVYDFLDYGDYIRSFLWNIVKKGK